MRKILLASTALVAFGTVAANAADVTITGATDWHYISYDNSSDTAGTNGTYFDHDFDMDVAFTNTTDSGLSLKMAFGVSESGVDDGYFSIAGDFGTVKMINNSGGIMGGAISETVADDVTKLTIGLANKHDEGNAEASYTHSGVQYTLPTMGGLSIAAEYRDGGVADKADTTAYMATYNTDIAEGATLKLNYGSTTTKNTQSSATDGYEGTSTGFTVAMSDIAISGSRHTYADNANSYDYTTDIVDVSYTGIDGITLAAFTKSGEDGLESSYDYSATAASVTYTIATGLTTSLTTTDAEVTDGGTKTEDSSMVLNIKAAF
jgi:hypothetical protein